MNIVVNLIKNIFMLKIIYSEQTGLSSCSHCTTSLLSDSIGRPIRLSFVFPAKIFKYYSKQVFWFEKFSRAWLPKINLCSRTTTNFTFWRVYQDGHTCKCVAIAGVRVKIHLFLENFSWLQIQGSGVGSGPTCISTIVKKIPSIFYLHEKYLRNFLRDLY